MKRQPDNANYHNPQSIVEGSVVAETINSSSASLTDNSLNTSGLSNDGAVSKEGNS